MKKIMFNDKYGLTNAVLQGTKTMTRRIIPQHVVDYYEYEAEDPTLIDAARYWIGDVVAVAQSYKDLGYTKEWVERHIKPNPNAKPTDPFEKKYPGWNNKMFVRADLMPHQIRITDIKVERLQDISDKDCLCEGVLHSDKYAMPYGITEVAAPNGVFFYYSSLREAFAALIDKVSGKGTWESNPYVFAYTFELIK